MLCTSVWESAMIDWKAWVKIGKQTQLQVKGKEKKQQTVEDKWCNVQTVVSSSILSLHTLTLVLNFSSSAIFPLFTCHCDSFHLCWIGSLLHMTKGECCRGPELNRIPFTLKEFLKTGHSFPPRFEVVRRAILFSFPYVAIHTTAFLNVTCPF